MHLSSSVVSLTFNQEENTIAGCRTCGRFKKVKRRILNRWKVIRPFLESEKQEQIVELHATYQARKMCRVLSLSDDPITVHLVRLELDSGQASVLVTSLVDCHAFDPSLFQHLYRHCWPVEDDYRQMKVRLEVEN